MTQVWMIRNSDTDIHLFNRFEHLKPSVEISYSRCQEVVIKESWPSQDFRGKVIFTITGRRGSDNSSFEDKVIAIRLPVWTEPSHL